MLVQRARQVYTSVDQINGHNFFIDFTFVSNIFAHKKDAFVNYSSFNDGERIEFKVKFNGPKYDPLEEDSLSTIILKNQIDNYSYQYHEGSEFPNSLKFMSK